MTLIGLPVDFHGSDKPNAVSELVIQASGARLWLQTFDDMPLSKRIRIKASFPKDNEFESFRMVAEIVWKDVYFWEGWEEYQYAVKFFEILNGHYLKLKRLLYQLSSAEKTPSQINHGGGSV